MRFSLCAAVAFVALLQVSSFGQDPDTHHDIACSSNSDMFLKDGDVELVPLSAAEAAKSIAGLKGISYTGFDSSRFATSTVTFYLRRTLTRVSQWPNDNAELTIVFSTSAGANTRGYEMRPGKNADDWLFNSEQASGSHAAQRENGFGRVTIIRATPDRAVPILKISFHTNNDGVNTQADAEKVFILDVRQLPPGILSALDCTTVTGGGACTVWDNGNLS